MHPLFTVIAGVAVGVMGVRLTKSASTRRALQSTTATGRETVRAGLNQTRGAVRGAAVSSLKTIEKTSAALREKLDNTSPKEGPDTSAYAGSAGTAQANDGGGRREEQQEEG